MTSGNNMDLDTDTKNAGNLNSKIAHMVKLNRYRRSWKKGNGGDAENFRLDKRERFSYRGRGFRVHDLNFEPKRRINP